VTRFVPVHRKGAEDAEKPKFQPKIFEINAQNGSATICAKAKMDPDPKALPVNCRDDGRFPWDDGLQPTHPAPPILIWLTCIMVGNALLLPTLHATVLARITGIRVTRFFGKCWVSLCSTQPT